MAGSSNKDEKPGREVLDSKLVRLLDKDDILALDIYTASLLGDYQVVRDHINAGFDVNRPNYSGWTPLIYSAYVGKDTVLNLLLESKAKVDTMVPQTGMTAMMYAASCGNESVVYFLLQQGGNINKQDKQGRTSLFHAASRGAVNVVKLLLDHNADMEIRERVKGNTPLLETAAEGYEVICSLLLEHGANKNAKNLEGHNPRTLAELYGNTMITDLLEQRTRGKNAAPLRSEAWIGEGSTEKSLFQDLNPKAMPNSVKESLIVTNSLPGSSTKNRFSTKAKSSRENILFAPVRSRDMVAPINASDHELSNHTFYGVDSGSELSFSEHEAKDNRRSGIAANSEVSACRRGLTVDHGEAKEKNHGRVSPKPSKASRVYSDVPVTVSVLDHVEEKRACTIACLLEEIKLTKYLSCFEARGVDFATFLTLTDESLKDIGIDKLGPRKKILSAIQRYNNDRQNDHQRGGSHSQVDTATQLQQAHAMIKQLETQLYKEQVTRREMEAYFVSEQGRLTRLMHLAQETKRDCEEGVKTLAIAKRLQSDVSKGVNALRDSQDLHAMFPTDNVGENIIDVQRSLEGQLVSLNTNLSLAVKQVTQMLQVLQSESLSDTE